MDISRVDGLRQEQERTTLTTPSGAIQHDWSYVTQTDAHRLCGAEQRAGPSPATNRPLERRLVLSAAQTPMQIRRTVTPSTLMEKYMDKFQIG